MSGRILITPRSLSRGGHPGLNPLTDAGYELVFPSPGTTPSEADLLAAVPGCVGWLAGVEPVSESVIAHADSLRVISRNGTGIDNLPIEAIEARAISIQRAEGSNARGVAELALGLVISGLRDIVPTNMGLKDGGWPRRIGKEIRNSRVSVIGLGAIGARFAKLALAVGAPVRGYDPFAPADVLVHERFERTDFDTAIAGANVLSLHVPMASDGTALIGASELASVAEGAVVVNTARAGLVDSEAMVAALESGQVGTYATDVFETEPPSPSKLLAHPRVIATSHIGGFTVESVERATRRAVDNILSVLESHAG